MSSVRYVPGVLQGVWVCQRCRRPTVRGYEVDDQPTCGQRDRYYCPLCATEQDFHFYDHLTSDALAAWVERRQQQTAEQHQTTAPSSRAIPALPQQPTPTAPSSAPVDAILVEPTLAPEEGGLAAPTPVVHGPANVIPQPSPALVVAAAASPPVAMPRPAAISPTASTASLLPGVGTPRAALEDYLREHFPTESSLQRLREYLAGDVLPAIDAAVRERALCSICLDEPRSVIALPCKHRCLCECCLRDMQKRKEAATATAADKALLCPLCREPMRDWIIPFN